MIYNLFNKQIINVKALNKGNLIVKWIWAERCFKHLKGLRACKCWQGDEMCKLWLYSQGRTSDSYFFKERRKVLNIFLLNMLRKANKGNMLVHEFHFVKVEVPIPLMAGDCLPMWPLGQDCPGEPQAWLTAPPVHLRLWSNEGKDGSLRQSQKSSEHATAGVIMRRWGSDFLDDLVWKRT